MKALFRGGCQTRLEVQFQSELDLSRIVERIARRPDLSKVSAGEVSRTADRHNAVSAEIRSVEGGVIEKVEKLRTEFHAEAFGNLEGLEGREIHPLKARPGNLCSWTAKQAETKRGSNATRWGVRRGLRARLVECSRVADPVL